MSKDIGSEGCIDKEFPLPVYPFPRTTLKPKRYMDKGGLMTGFSPVQGRPFCGGTLKTLYL